MISILIPYKNREYIRIKRCLKSLSIQTDTDFEVILVDNGSDMSFAKGINNLINQYSFCKYIYTETKGFIWNRGYALNVAVNNCKGDILIVADADLIFAPNFLNQVNYLNFKDNFYNYKCIYLPEKFDYNKLLWNSLMNFRFTNSENSRGLLIVAKQYIANINGYDEYYQQWGVEDDDMVRRLKQINLTQKYLPENEYMALHQWHKESYTNVPTMWYLHMLNYCEQNQDVKRNLNGFGKIISTRDRFDFGKETNQNQTIVLKKYLSVTCYNEIVSTFLNCKPNEIIKIEYQQPSEFDGTGFIKKVKNFVLRYVIKSPNLPNQNAVLAKSVLTTETLFDFMVYFIGINRSYVFDYRIEYTPQTSLSVFILKK